MQTKYDVIHVADKPGTNDVNRGKTNITGMPPYHTVSIAFEPPKDSINIDTNTLAYSGPRYGL